MVNHMQLTSTTPNRKDPEIKTLFKTSKSSIHFKSVTNNRLLQKKEKEQLLFLHFFL